jgi:tRNA(fMet)-specific endonuclease VapC
MGPRTLLDSDILSALMRREKKVLDRSRDYLNSHAQLSLSLITRYEILRGLKAKNASTQLDAFQQFCDTCQVLGITEEIVDRASDIYADLYRRGALVGDADILIAATALAHDLVLATNNLAHFSRIATLKIDNWLE